LAGALDQEGQQLERDALKADWLTAATKLVGELVELEVLKSKGTGGMGKPSTGTGLFYLRKEVTYRYR